jgi:hypothetical protein
MTNDPDRTRLLQERINSALRELPEERAQSNFSPYMPDAAFGVENELTRADKEAGGGYPGIEAALDEFARLVQSEGVDVVRARYGLQRFLAHYSGLAGLGLRLPSLQERAPWKLKPSSEEPE